MKRFIFISLTLLLSTLCIPAAAQVRNTRDYITVRLIPDHSEWNYCTNESPLVSLSVERTGCILPDMTVNCEWGPELRTPDRQWTVKTGKKGLHTLTLKGASQPGFMTLKASVSYEGKRYTNYINLAFSPDQIVPTTTLPADFISFWQTAVNEVRAVPLMTDLIPHPELNTDQYIAYEVRFQNHKKGCYLYGLMQIPRNTDGTPLNLSGEKRYPVMIEWPGAGVKSHKGIESIATDAGYIILEMGVNGISVTQPESIYRDLKANALSHYWTTGLDNRDTYYYKPIYAGTVKTVDMLCALPFIDTTRIVVSGGSQGGALSLVHAALDSRVKAVSAAYPALSEIAGFYHGRVAGWPQILADASEPARAEKAAVAAYYDVVNFARFVSQPCKLFIGYNDRTCCPTSTLSVWSVLGEKAPTPNKTKKSPAKELFVVQDCAHWQYPEHRQARHHWVLSAE